MSRTLKERFRHAWNIFTSNDDNFLDYGNSYFYRPDRPILTRGNDRSIINSVYTRIAIDVSAIDIKHVRLDDEGRYLETIDSSLNKCLNIEANVDQTGRMLMYDIVLSMLDEGCIALVPVDTEIKISDKTNIISTDIKTLRVGKIIEWYPNKIKVNLYNDKTGLKEDIIISKSNAAIIENPFYSVMNEPNSTMQRLLRKLNLLDAIDEQSGSGKLDLIIQLPYAVRNEKRRGEAESRRKDIERQLMGTKYGIAYADSSEKITQLNRPIENNMMKQIEYLTTTLYGQLGISSDVMAGTASESVMLNYINRTIEPITNAIVDELTRKFLSKTARSQGQSFMFFTNPFRLVTVSEIAKIADTFTRNEIMSSNEVRQIIGLKPSSDPSADELRNKNLNAPESPMYEEETTEDVGADPTYDENSMYEEEIQNE